MLRTASGTISCVGLFRRQLPRPGPVFAEPDAIGAADCGGERSTDMSSVLRSVPMRMSLVTFIGTLTAWKPWLATGDGDLVCSLAVSRRPPPALAPVVAVNHTLASRHPFAFHSRTHTIVMLLPATVAPLIIRNWIGSTLIETLFFPRTLKSRHCWARFTC